MKKMYLILLIMLVATLDLNSSADLKEERFSVIYKRQIKLEKEFEDIKKRYNVSVKVTAYSPSIDETDSTPYETSSGERVRPWTVAISRDLYNIGWTEGKIVYIDQFGRFEILDKMKKDSIMSVDIFFTTKEQAIKFGKRENVLMALLELHDD